MKSPNHTFVLHSPTSSSSTSRGYPLLRTDCTGCSRNSAAATARDSDMPRVNSETYIAAERTWTYSERISRDRYVASVLARRSGVEKEHNSLLLSVGPCLQRFRLATR
jgi:hypothetical protein